jgi:hypothetical protein
MPMHFPLLNDDGCIFFINPTANVTKINITYKNRQILPRLNDRTLYFNSKKSPIK